MELLSILLLILHHKGTFMKGINDLLIIILKGLGNAREFMDYPICNYSLMRRKGRIKDTHSQCLPGPLSIMGNISILEEEEHQMMVNIRRGRQR